MTSSSGSMPAPYNAVLRRGEESLGPIRLPEENVSEFIEEFDHTYRNIGMTIARTMIIRDGPEEVSLSLVQP